MHFIAVNAAERARQSEPKRYREREREREIDRVQQAREDRASIGIMLSEPKLLMHRAMHKPINWLATCPCCATWTPTSSSSDRPAPTLPMVV